MVAAEGRGGDEVVVRPVSDAQVRKLMEELDAVKALVSTASRPEVPDMPALNVELAEYNDLLLAEVGT